MKRVIRKGVAGRKRRLPTTQQLHPYNFQHASWFGRLDCMKQCLQSNDITVEEWQIALRNAVQLGRLDIVRWIIQCTADAETKGRDAVYVPVAMTDSKDNCHVDFEEEEPFDLKYDPNWSCSSLKSLKSLKHSAVEKDIEDGEVVAELEKEVVVRKELEKEKEVGRGAGVTDGKKEVVRKEGVEGVMILDDGEEEDLLSMACSRNDLQMVYYLLTIRPKANLLARQGEILFQTVQNNQFVMLQLFKQMRPFLDITICNDKAFRLTSCNSANAKEALEIAQFLKQWNPNVNVSAMMNEAFRNSIVHLHLNFAMWLITFPSVDPYDMDCDVFYKALTVSTCFDILKYICPFFPSEQPYHFKNVIQKVLQSEGGSVVLLKTLLTWSTDIPLRHFETVLIHASVVMNVDIAMLIWSLRPQLRLDPSKLIGFVHGCCMARQWENAFSILIRHGGFCGVHTPIPPISEFSFRKHAIRNSFVYRAILNDEPQMCVVCFTESAAVQRLPCSHGYCISCFLKFTKQWDTCGICRRTFPTE